MIKNITPFLLASLTTLALFSCQYYNQADLTFTIVNTSSRNITNAEISSIPSYITRFKKLIDRSDFARVSFKSLPSGDSISIKTIGHFNVKCFGLSSDSFNLNLKDCIEDSPLLSGHSTIYIKDWAMILK